MELGLSLGDASKGLGFLENSTKKQQQQKGIIKLDICMGLGLKSYEETHKSEENDDEICEDNNTLQLNLLPLVPRRISPCSSYNGSSENGSSGNMAQPPPVKGLEVNRLLAAEEVSSANSVGSPFQMDLGIYMRSSSNKRDFEATRGNDVVEGERASSKASDDDDDENGVTNRKKLRLSKQQSVFLEQSFKEHNTLNPKQKQALAKQLNLRPRQVEVWFQNRRARTKLKQTEVDCEYLKRCSEKLTEENRRLHRELQELRALKTSNPFYMQLPATTLTMCPSCERVATMTTAPPPRAGKSGTTNGTTKPKVIPFPFNRPRFYPFSQTPTHPNQPAGS